MGSLDDAIGRARSRRDQPAVPARPVVPFSAEFTQAVADFLARVRVERNWRGRPKGPTSWYLVEAYQDPDFKGRSWLLRLDLDGTLAGKPVASPGFWEKGPFSAHSGYIGTAELEAMAVEEMAEIIVASGS